MSDKYSNRPTRVDDKDLIKKKIHRALVEARNARYHGDEEAVRDIISRIMADAAPVAYKASKEGSFNWVVEALKPLDEMLLPDDD
jgi:hypothetical protein